MIFKLAVKNIWHKPLSSLLSVLLVAMSVGIILLLLHLQSQLGDKFEKDLKDFDVVVGAKGSPLQLVLSAVYHLDAPTGNIPMSEVKTLLKNPMVAKSIPLAYGDVYQSYRIVGTTTGYIDKYDGQIASGHLWSRDMEAVLGSSVSARSGLSVGDVFVGSHGQAGLGHEHDDHPYEVVGTLEPTGTVLDNLILTSVPSVWHVHDEHGDDSSNEDSDHEHEGHDHGHEGHDHGHEGHDHEHEGHDHGHEGHDHGHEDHDDGHEGHDHGHESHDHGHEGHDHGHEGHDHGHEGHDHEHEGHDHGHEGHDHEHEGHSTGSSSLQQKQMGWDDNTLAEYPDSAEVTALLLNYKSRMVALNMPRLINEQTNMMAALPGPEVNRLFYLLGIGTQTLTYVAVGIMVMSALSVFFVLYGRLRERKAELALLRASGYSAGHLFFLLLLEGVLLTFIGYCLGFMLCRLGLLLLNAQVAGDFQVRFGYGVISQEFWILLITLGVGVVAALVPAIKSMRLDVARILTAD